MIATGCGVGSVLFHECFAFRLFDLVSDQGKEPLAHYEVDESIREDLRRVINESPGS
jgi:hypothetical protein